MSLDPIYAYFDADEQIFLRYGGGARQRRERSPRQLADPHGARQRARASRARASMDFLDNQLDGATGTIRGRAVFRNTDGLLTPGLFVRLRLAGGGASRALLIQDRAVGTDLDKKFVYVVGADRTRSVPAPSRSARSSTGCASCAAARAPATVVVNGCSACGWSRGVSRHGRVRRSDSGRRVAMDAGVMKFSSSSSSGRSSRPCSR